MSNNTNPATYGDTRSAKEIAKGQIDSAHKLLLDRYYGKAPGHLTNAAMADALHALDREAQKRGVK